ncbi:MAG: hypothetical protein PQJ49_01480 [Sphaerochaetaceae bacterium]|nr:hypothetical protein [Sphaerochaetaceae bacterium]
MITNTDLHSSRAMFDQADYIVGIDHYQRPKWWMVILNKLGLYKLGSSFGASYNLTIMRRNVDNNTLEMIKNYRQ